MGGREEQVMHGMRRGSHSVDLSLCSAFKVGDRQLYG